MNPRKRTIRLIPSVKLGNGTGHLRRCLETAKILEETFDADARVLIDTDGPTLSAVDAILAAYPNVGVSDGFLAEAADIAVVDRRESDRGYVDQLKTYATVVGLDEAGPARGYCDYLIDSLPAVGTRQPPNREVQASRAPNNRKQLPSETHDNILVTFGGEDPAGLTPPVCAALVDGGISPARISAVRGTSAAAWEVPAGISVLENLHNLRDRLHEYDLIITSFGLTAYEALSAGTAVLTVNPTAYHTRLSRSIGFPCAGTGGVDANILLRVVNDPAGHRTRMEHLLADLESRGWDAGADGIALLADAIVSLRTEGTSRCPVCGNDAAPAVARFESSTFFLCPCSGLIYQRRFDAVDTEYDGEYFFADYRAQYGKTYLEDYDHIKELGRARLSRIRSLVPAPASLLDVGCAYGPFLDAAGDSGYAVFGTDISKDAVAYVRDKLGVPAEVAAFPDLDAKRLSGNSTFDVLTMWYVIEHFENLDAVLRTVSDLVAPSGVFAFATPNVRGISGRRSVLEFLRKSPGDHVTVWSPASARRVLRRYGFRVKKVRITGHHPERFPGVPGNRRSVRSYAASLLSRTFGLGDTFEVYAVRKDHSGNR